MKTLASQALFMSAWMATAVPSFGQVPRFAFEGGAGLVRLQSTQVTLGVLQGSLFSGEGRVSLGRLELATSYAEGTLNPQNVGLPSRDLVEGFIMLGVHPVPWLLLKAGPHARGFLQAGVTERWLFWEGRVRVDALVASPLVRGYLELGGALGGSTRNAAADFGNSRAGEAGMILRLAHAPISFRIAYGIERSRLATGTGLDAIERITAAIGVGARH